MGIIVSIGIGRIAVTRCLSRGPIRANAPAFIVFAFFNLIYTIYLNYIQICSHGRSILKLNTWVATVREEKSPDTRGRCDAEKEDVQEAVIVIGEHVV